MGLFNFLSKNKGDMAIPRVVKTIPEDIEYVLDVRNESDQADLGKKYTIYRVPEKEIVDLSLLMKKLDVDKRYVLVCYAGVRSLGICNHLRMNGFNKVHSYAKGYKEFLRQEA